MSGVPNNFAIMRQVTAQLLDVRPAPYRISINHDISPPKNVACPMHYDWRHGRTVGVTEKLKPIAATWIAEALARGYTVSRLDRTGFNAVEIVNLTSARQRAKREAEHAAMTPEQRQIMDDEIPFMCEWR